MSGEERVCSTALHVLVILAFFSFRISVFGLGSVLVSVETLCQCACDGSPVSDDI